MAPNRRSQRKTVSITAKKMNESLGIQKGTQKAKPVRKGRVAAAKAKGKGK